MTDNQPECVALILVYDNGKRFELAGGTFATDWGEWCYADLLAAETQGKLVDHRLSLRIRERDE